MHNRFWPLGVLVLLALALSFGCAPKKPTNTPTLSSGMAPIPSPTPAPDANVQSFSHLKGWNSDVQAEALAAFRGSCTRILTLAPGAPLDRMNKRSSLYGVARDWQPACQAATSIPPTDNVAARKFFEQWFLPVDLPEEPGVKPLFTGYYEPEMKGSLVRGGPYQTPVLAPPPGYIAARARGETGPSRAAIEGGAFDTNKLAIAWLADPVDAFFLHVQGSGRMHLPDGRVMRLNFAAKNGLPYSSIGQVLIKRGAIEAKTVSMQTVRAWLSRHPSQAREVMQKNESYIFFKRVEDSSPELGPVGAEGVPLTSGRSLAVDRDFHPTGTLLWLDSRFPQTGGSGPFRRLMVAQDTGSAILGLQRGDIFWGSGDEAAKLAGHMSERGHLTALLPRSLVEAREARLAQ